MEFRKARKGQRVRSQFRARWFGVIIDKGERRWIIPHSLGKELYIPPGCLLVRVTHTADGRPQPKPFLKTIAADWVEPLDKSHPLA